MKNKADCIRVLDDETSFPIKSRKCGFLYHSSRIRCVCVCVCLRVYVCVCVCGDGHAIESFRFVTVVAVI